MLQLLLKGCFRMDNVTGLQNGISFGLGNCMKWSYFNCDGVPFCALMYIHLRTLLCMYVHAHTCTCR